MSKKQAKGSMTVEAAFAFPLFFFACMALCYLFVFIRAEYIIQRELYYTAREITGYGPLIEPVVELRDSLWGKAESGIYDEDTDKKRAADIISAFTALLPETNGFSIKNIVDNAADAMIVGSVVERSIPDEVLELIDGGASGIDFYGTELYDIEKCLSIVCGYKLKLPIGIFPDIKIPVEHKIRFRYYTGTEVKSLLTEVVQEEESAEEMPEEEPEEEKEEEVYIAETGHCYHYSDKCPSLNVRPKKINFEAVGAKRNEGGAKYYPCEFCAVGKRREAICYITPDGDRYHFNGKCQGLKRTIELVPISKVGKRRECKRCIGFKKSEG